MRQIFDEVQKISKCGCFDMPLRSTFEISTQIILLKIDGFLKGWILNITPLKVLILSYLIIFYANLSRLPIISINYFGVTLTY